MIYFSVIVIYVTREVIILIGDLVYYIGPPIVNPPLWKNIVENDNGIINSDDIGIVVSADSFLKIADVFFQRTEITIKRISFRKLELLK